MKIEAARNARRIVVKIGTRSLLLDDRSFDFKTIASVVQDIKQLLAGGREVVLVTSGAVSAGMRRLGLEKRPRDVVMQQVAASVGNPLLMNEYVRMFDEVAVAQVLLTQQDLSNRRSYVHFSNAMELMLKKGIVPIVNENDVVSIDELVGTKTGELAMEYNFSDNDVLSALVATSISADLLVILSDVEGLYTRHPDSPGAELIPLVEDLDDEILRGAASGGTSMGRGGMVTKLKAAQICAASGTWMVIANAKSTSIPALLEGRETRCTWFKPREKMPGKKLWIIFAANVEGKLFLDDGATRAIQEGASVLLPGIVDVDGTFKEGAVVELCDPGGNVIGRGVVRYSAKEIRRFRTLYNKDREMFKLQGVREVIHRDRLAIMK